MNFEKFTLLSLLLAASLMAVQSNAIELTRKISDNVLEKNDSSLSSRINDSRHVVITSTAKNLITLYTGHQGNVSSH